ncbi:MAG: hypothetical protein HZB64_01520 [Rhodocyclales bacterium]|nr:hypothetical protein [Rhodocyclales bacterium]
MPETLESKNTKDKQAGEKMRFLKGDVLPSPETSGYVRTSGELVWGRGKTFQLWVDVPEAYAESLSDTGNPWLLAMLPMAASLGEDIELALPVDALLLENVKGVLAIWREWYPELHDVRIHCPVQSYQAQGQVPSARRTAAFFSGGIDSYFTIARRMPGNEFGIPAVGKVDDLLTVWGFDVGVYDEAQFRPLANMLATSARQLELRQIVFRTNLRAAEKLIPFKDMWRRLSHGAGLAFIGLILEKAYKEVMIGSSYTYGSLFPWGSHPLQDVLFSTSVLQIVHDGASFTRVEKTDVVARLPVAQAALHVCLAQGDSNCSRCDKCYRTMMTLDLLGHREHAGELFDWSGYRVEAIRKLFIRSKGDRIFRSDIIAAAKKYHRQDIVDALKAAERRSKVLRPLVKISEWLMTWPGIWRLGISAKAFLLRGPIRKI